MREQPAFTGTHNPTVIECAKRIEQYLRPHTYNPNTFDCSIYSIVMDALNAAKEAK